jgi:pimeloyl-ACP methyl ester carboxylesterase
MDRDPVLAWAEDRGFEGRFVTAGDGTRLRLVTGGPARAPRVVLLHGAPQLSYMWRRVLPELAGRYRVIAPDLRGYGASDLSATGRYDLDTLVSDLDTIIDETGEPGEPVVLVAHDWGGPIAWRYVERRPERVLRFVAANAPHPGAYARELARPSQAVRSWYIALFQVPRLERLIERRRAALFVDMMRWSSPRAAIGETDLAFYRAALSRPGRAAAVLAYYREAFGSGLVARLREVLASPRVAAPTTILWGDADLALAPTHPEATLRYAPDARVVRLEGVSHWVPEERPLDVVSAVMEGDDPAS